MEIVNLVNEYLMLDMNSPTYLSWKRLTGSKRIKVGDAAFTTIEKNGYYRGSILGKKIFAHQASYILKHGYLPKMIDHIDRDTLNCDPSNLRPTTVSLNACNKGAAGCSFKAGKWEAYFRREYLGRFDTKEEAMAASEIKRSEYVRVSFGV